MLWAPGPTDVEGGWPSSSYRGKKHGEPSQHRGAAMPQRAPVSSFLCVLSDSEQAGLWILGGTPSTAKQVGSKRPRQGRIQRGPPSVNLTSQASLSSPAKRDTNSYFPVVGIQREFWKIILLITWHLKEFHMWPRLSAFS